VLSLDFLWRHEVTVEAYEGDGAYGPVYAAPVTVRCFLDQKTRTVVDKEGQEVVSHGTLYAPLATVCPPESRITLPNGDTATVINALRHDGGGLPTPDHLEVQL
jgi:hypothetical protein